MRTTIWTLLILLVVGLACYKTSLNEDRRARYREHKQRLDSAMALGDEVARSVRIALKQGMPLEEFTTLIGEVTPEDDGMAEGSADVQYTYFHRPSQRTFSLRFEDGVLRWFGSNHGYDDVDTGIVFDSPAYLLSERVRGLTLFVCCVAWAGMLVVMIWKAEHRTKLARGLLVLSCLCLLCWFLAGHYSPTWRGIRSNDGLAYGAFMIIFSLGLKGVRYRCGAPMNALHAST